MRKWVRKLVDGKQPARPSAAWKPDPDARKRAFYTTRNYPIYYLSITKCGSTFLKNVFYALDHNHSHPDGEHVHDTERGLIRARDVPTEDILTSPYVFTVLRDPRERFLSFYFDKIYGDGPRNFPALRNRLKDEIGLNLVSGLTAAHHVDNCIRLAGWIDKNLKGATDEPINFHWRQQSARLRRVREFDIVPLTLDGLNWQLPEFLRPVIPDLAARMEAVTERNHSSKEGRPKIEDTPELDAELRRIYAQDYDRYIAAKEAWAGQETSRRGVSIPAIIPHPKGHVRVFASHNAKVAAVAATDVVADTISALFATLDDTSRWSALADLSPEELTEYRSIAVIRDPVLRLLDAYAQLVVLNRSMWHRRVVAAVNGIAPKLEDPAETHRAYFYEFVSMARRRLKRDGDHAVIQIRPQNKLISSAVESGMSLIRYQKFADDMRAHLIGEMLEKLDHADPGTAPGNALPDGIVSQELEAMIRGLYAADNALYQQALAAEDAPR
jgi:hypothetical protein